MTDCADTPTLSDADLERISQDVVCKIPTRAIDDRAKLLDEVRRLRAAAVRAPGDTDFEQKLDWLVTVLLEAGRTKAGGWAGKNGMISFRELAQRTLRPIYSAACGERDAWIETARQHCGNEQYYRGLVVSIGETIGEAAYIQDDGGKAEDVLCAKVPQLVKQCNTEREYWKTFEPRALAAESALSLALVERDRARTDALEEAAKVVEAVSTWNGDSSYCENCKNGTIYPDGEDIAKSIRSLKGVAA